MLSDGNRANENGVPGEVFGDGSGSDSRMEKIT